MPNFNWQDLLPIKATMSFQDLNFYTWIIFTLGSNLGGRPKCRIQLSLAPRRSTTSACRRALPSRNGGGGREATVSKRSCIPFKNSIAVRGATWSAQQPHSLGDHREGPPSPWVWAETAGHSLPQTPSDQFLLGCKLHLLQ